MVDNLKRFGLVFGALLTTIFITLQVTQAYGGFFFQGKSYNMPKDVSPFFTFSDCTNKELVGLSELIMCPNKTYKSYISEDGWSALFFRPSEMTDDVIAESQYPEGAPKTKDTFQNFLDLTSGKKQISDFYASNGLLLNNMSRVFDLPYAMDSIVHRATFDYIRDVVPLIKDDKIVGFSYTPIPVEKGSLDFFGYHYRFFTACNISDDVCVTATKKIRSFLPSGELAYFFFSYLFTTTSDSQPEKYNRIEDYYIDHRDLLAQKAEDYYTKYLTDYKKNITEWDRIFLSIVSNTPKALFADVPFSDSFADYIYYLTDKGYLDVTKTTFLPNKLLNRAELLKMVIGANHDVTLENYKSESCFTDVPVNQWYTKYICYAKSKKIVKGYVDGTFGIGKNVTEAEALKIALTSFGVSIDQSGQSLWYKPYYDFLIQKNWNVNLLDNPNKQLERKDFARLLSQILYEMNVIR